MFSKLQFRGLLWPVKLFIVAHWTSRNHVINNYTIHVIRWFIHSFCFFFSWLVHWHVARFLHISWYIFSSSGSPKHFIHLLPLQTLPIVAFGCRIKTNIWSRFTDVLCHRWHNKCSLRVNERETEASRSPAALGPRYISGKNPQRSGRLPKRRDVLIYGRSLSAWQKTSDQWEVSLNWEVSPRVQLNSSIHFKTKVAYDSLRKKARCKVQLTLMRWHTPTFTFFVVVLHCLPPFSPSALSVLTCDHLLGRWSVQFWCICFFNF